MNEREEGKLATQSASVWQDGGRGYCAPLTVINFQGRMLMMGYRSSTKDRKP